MSSPATTEIEVGFVFLKRDCAAGTFFKACAWWEFLVFLGATFAPFRYSILIGFHSIWTILITICFLGAVLTAFQAFKSIVLALKHEEWIVSGDLRSKFEDFTKLRMYAFYAALLVFFGPVIIIMVFVAGFGGFTLGSIIQLIIETLIYLYIYFLLPMAFTPALEQSADILCGGGAVFAKEPMVHPSDFAPH